MADFIVDASAALAWCFEDEANSWSDGLLERLRQGDTIVIPAHWQMEITNALLVAVRRQRLKPGQPDKFLDAFGSLPIEVEPAISFTQAKRLLDLAQKHNLTVYDASYLELAMRRRLAFATLDSDLLSAARRENVLLL